MKTTKDGLATDYDQTTNRYTYLDAYHTSRVDRIINKIATYFFFTTLDLESAYRQIPTREGERTVTDFKACGGAKQLRRVRKGVTNTVPCSKRVIDEIIHFEELDATFEYTDGVIG